MTNPEIVRGKTPNGGDYSEMYYLDKSGNLAKTTQEAVEFRILEKTDAGELVQTTYGVLRRG